MSNNIEGKVVVITGASSVSERAPLATSPTLGATVVLGARRKDRLNAIVKDIEAAGGKALAVSVDVTQRDRGRIIGQQSHQHVWQDRRPCEQCRYHADRTAFTSQGG